MSELLLQVNDLSKIFDMGAFKVEAVKNISIDIKKGEFIGLIGPSGSGKTTLINTLCGLSTPSSGRILLNNEDLSIMNAKQLRDYRLQNIGLVFQEHLLIESMTTLENAELPLIFQNIPEDERHKKAKVLLKRFGLLDKADHLPEELSGGEKQRLGIARALITNPILILADEPTGNIDVKAGNEVMKIFKDITTTSDTSIIMVSHNPAHISKFDRVLKMQDGNIMM